MAARDATIARSRASTTTARHGAGGDGRRRRRRDAERAFRAKYGDALRPKPRLIATDVKHFDSADWAMRKSAEEARRAGRGRDGARRERGAGEGIDDVGDDGG